MVVVVVTGLVEEVEEAGMVGSPMVAEEVDVAATGVERDGEAEKGLRELRFHSAQCGRSIAA